MQLIKDISVDNEILAIRLELCVDRIKEMVLEQEAAAPYQDYFKRTSMWLCEVFKLWEPYADQDIVSRLAQGQMQNKAMYQLLDEDHYDQSYACYTYAQNMLGAEYGKLLCALFGEMAALPIYIQQERYEEAVILLELYLEIYGMFTYEEMPRTSQIYKAIYWYISDYCDTIVDAQMIREYQTGDAYIKKLVMDSDTDKQLYLYEYGYYISTKEKFLQSHMAFEEEAAVDAQAELLVQSFIDELDSSKSQGTVRLLYEIGCERLVKQVILKLEARGFKAILCADSLHMLMRQQPDEYSMIPEFCEDFREEHWQDLNIFLNKALMERRKTVYMTVSDHYKEDRDQYLGTLACTYELI